MEKLLYTKYEGWGYEEESRNFTRLEEVDEATGFYFTDFGENIKLKEVILGLKCTVKENQIKEILCDSFDAVRIINVQLAFESFKVIEKEAGKE